MPTLDTAVERVGRWTAARTTRRSFLHRLGQLAVVVAAGPAIANLLMRRAEARVCGQTGVTPKCSTFDCVGEGRVWGWCWYASDGCCRNDGLKKICDCCTLDYPNVHGYCPSGTNVECIVESCGEDPRLMETAIVPVSVDAAGSFNGPAIDAGQGTSAYRVVIADNSDAWIPLIAAPLAGTLGVPVVPVGNDGVSMLDLGRLDRLGVVIAMTVGPVSSAVTDALTGAGLTVESVTASSDLETVSVAVANRIRSINEINRTVTVATTGLSAAAGVIAANFAALSGFPLAVGDAAAVAIGMPTVAIGPEPADLGVVGSQRTTSTSVVELARELTELAAATPFVNATEVVLVPQGTGNLSGLINLQATIVFHPVDELALVANWLTNHGLRYGKWTKVFLVQGPGQLSPEEYWRLQGTVNGFRVDDLMGVPGEGLPVFRQPWAERPIGMARTDGALPWGSEPQGSYWTNVAQTFRD